MHTQAASNHKTLGTIIPEYPEACTDIHSTRQWKQITECKVVKLQVTALCQAAGSEHQTECYEEVRPVGPGCQQTPHTSDI